MIFGCVQDFGISTVVEDVEEILPTEVIIQSLVQPAETEQLDVLVILDTSCSMNDNYEQVSRGIELLKGDIETIPVDYQIGFINTSLRDPYFIGPFTFLKLSVKSPSHLYLNLNPSSTVCCVNVGVFTKNGNTAEPLAP